MQEFGLFRRVAEAEAGVGVDDAEAAALAGDGAMLATGGIVDGAGVSRRLVHDDLNLEGGSDAIPYVFVKCAQRKESKGVARILGKTVCGECAQGDEKKGDGADCKEGGFGCGARVSRGMLAQ